MALTDQKDGIRCSRIWFVSLSSGNDKPLHSARRCDADGYPLAVHGEFVFSTPYLNDCICPGNPMTTGQARSGRVGGTQMQALKNQNRLFGNTPKAGFGKSRKVL